MTDGFQGHTGSSAPEMPPLVRPPVPDPDHTQGDAVHLPFQRRQEQPAPAPTPTPAEELAILDAPVAEPELEARSRGRCPEPTRSSARPAGRCRSSRSRAR